MPNLVLDSHLDTLHEFVRLDIDDYDLSVYRPRLALDLPRLRAGGVNALFFALFTKQEWGVQGGQTRIARLYGILTQLLRTNPSLALSVSPDEVSRAIEGGKVSVSLGIENGVVLGDDLGMLKTYHDLGIRYLTLCHNAANQICDSSTSAPVHMGLSEFGVEVISRMNELGMMVDLSHASDRAADVVLDISTKPVIASHSNARAVHDNPRNLSDHLIRRIAERGGVVQVSALPKCVSGQAPTVADMVNHIDHIVQLVGPDHVGIGSDFDGGGRVAGFVDLSDAPNVTRQLKARAYSEADIRAIWGGNLMRVWAAQTD